MSYAFPPDVKQKLDAHLASGRFDSVDEVLRVALDSLVADMEDIEAIEESIREWQAGDEGVPLDEALRSIRRQHPEYFEG